MFNLIWRNIAGNIIKGFDGSNEIDTPVLHGIVFPSTQSDPIVVTVQSSAQQSQTFESLLNVKLYLTGDPAQIHTIQTVWPSLNGGLFISYNGGRSYSVFSTTYGYESNPSTWVTLPAITMGINGLDGILGPFDSARLVLRYIIPETADQFGIYNVSLSLDYDIV